MSAPTPYPFPYLDQDRLERRLDSPDSLRAMMGLTESEWGSLLEDIIGEESAFVHRQIVAQGVEPESYDALEQFLGAYPEVRQAMVRLCRASLNRIDEDGLQSESVGDHSETFRAPGELRSEVADYLAAIDPPDSDTDDDDRDRVTLL